MSSKKQATLLGFFKPLSERSKRTSSEDTDSSASSPSKSSQSVSSDLPLSPPAKKPRTDAARSRGGEKESVIAEKYKFQNNRTDESPDLSHASTKRREEFLRKFGAPANERLAKRNHNQGRKEKENGEEVNEEASAEETLREEGEEREEEEEEEEYRPMKRLRTQFACPSDAKSNISSAKAATKKAQESKKYTPLEKQFMEIKRQNPDTLLMVEVGYKYRFFGEDAQVASKELGIACFLDHNFYTASIPTHRLHVHVRRLVYAGHKVGVVQQTETAALKAAGDNRNAPFERKLTHLYTKGTFVDDMNTMDDETTAGGGYLMCLYEEVRGGSGRDEYVHLGLVAVHPSTGDIIYDNFEDGYMRSELETRLLHIQPCEMLLPAQLSKPTENLVKHLSAHHLTSGGDAVRVERLTDAFLGYNDAFTVVQEFYSRKMGENSMGDPMEEEEEKEPRREMGEAKEGVQFSEIMRFPRNVIVCLAALISHLRDFGLEHVFSLTKYFHPFSTRMHMLLNGNTLANLEIYRNQTDFSEKGSLFWVLDHTRTSFGRRLMRRWVGRPLVDIQQLNERMDAVEEILRGESPLLGDLRELLRKLPDLERGLCRIHYGKCSSAELLQILNALHEIATRFPGWATPEAVGLASPLLNDILAHLPLIRERVAGFRRALNAKAAERGDKHTLFADEDKYPDIGVHKEEIAGVERRFDEHLLEVRRLLKKPKLEYCTVAQVDYLIEVKNAEAKQVPKGWVKISGTKQVSRFHTPEVIALLRERDQGKERLSRACDEAFRRFLGEIAESYEVLRDVVQKLAVADCLFSLATVACQPGYVRPKFVEGTRIHVKQGRHPMVEQVLGGRFVPNDEDFDPERCRTMILTGPNMGGKSSYIRQVALISIMGQVGSYVPAEEAELGMLDAVYTRMGAFDNMLQGESTFMVELHETSDIMKQATPRSLVILDELGRGTSTHDGVAIAHAVLKYFVERVRAITLFVTHYPSLAKIAQSFTGVQNAHMGFMETENEDGSMGVVFLYKLTQGVAMRSYGLNVARLAHLPAALLERAAEKSAEMEESMRQKRAVRLRTRLRSAMEHWLRAAGGGLGWGAAGRGG
ncbi:uncharacterized protein VTP21DRAFT_5513 [Calcarisporiella thermophila]|uniref:uncharacterized protein n=1 Tax=Calcarisporiella thermophila TaxID=911321 RepID=UPI0037438682